MRVMLLRVTPAAAAPRTAPTSLSSSRRRGDRKRLFLRGRSGADGGGRCGAEMGVSPPENKEKRGFFSVERCCCWLSPVDAAP